MKQYTMTKRNRIILAVAAMGCAALLMSTLPSHAGTAGAEFSDTWTQLSGWIEGTLGRIVTTSMVLVGIGGAIARQSLTPFAVGAGGGMGLYATPTIVGNIFTGTLAASVPTAFVASQPVMDLTHIVSTIL